MLWVVIPTVYTRRVQPTVLRIFAFLALKRFGADRCSKQADDFPVFTVAATLAL